MFSDYIGCFPEKSANREFKIVASPYNTQALTIVTCQRQCSRLGYK